MLKKVFLRPKTEEEKIVFEETEIRESIRRVLEYGGWSLECLEDIIQKIGIKMPVKLRETAETGVYFISNDEVKQAIVFSVGVYGPKICIVHEDETGRAERRIYQLNKREDEDTELIVNFEERKILKNNVSLENYYSDFFVNRKLQIGKSYFLEINIDEPDKYEPKEEILVRRNSKKIEEYLLNLGLENNEKFLADAKEIYKKIIEMLDFSDELVLKCEDIKIIYGKNVEHREIMLSGFSVKNGELQEYAEMQDGVTYHVYKNRDWETYSSGCDIKYTKETKKYQVTVKGDGRFVQNESPRKELEKARKRINKLWEYVE